MACFSLCKHDKVIGGVTVRVHITHGLRARPQIRTLEKDGWGILRQTLQRLVGSDLVSVLECVRPMLPAFSGYSCGYRKSSLLVSGTSSR